MTNRVKDVAGRVKETAETARGKASQHYASARAGARDAGKRAADTIEENPLVAVLGAAAVGALAGVLLPATRREASVLGPLGGRIGDAAKTAMGAARDAGRETLGEFGISEDAVRSQFDRLIDLAAKAVSSAGDAATKAGRE